MIIIGVRVAPRVLSSLLCLLQVPLVLSFGLVVGEFDVAGLLVVYVGGIGTLDCR
jgi:hypothetical protein